MQTNQKKMVGIGVVVVIAIIIVTLSIGDNDTPTRQQTAVSQAVNQQSQQPELRSAAEPTPRPEQMNMPAGRKSTQTSGTAGKQQAFKPETTLRKSTGNTRTYNGPPTKSFARR